MKTTFIYALCEPGTRTVRYIGKTQDPKKRLREHVKNTSKETTHVGNWLRGLQEFPSMVILREVEGDGCEAEMRYIRLARGCSMGLTNATDGGEGVTQTPETRKKIGDSNRGEKNGMFGKRGEACPGYGRKASEETIAKLSASHMGQAGVRGEDNYWFGKVYSEEEKLVLSLSGKRGIKSAKASSKFLGVCWISYRERWRAALCAEGKTTSLGYFVNELDAARAYDAAAIAQFGSAIPLNFTTV